MSKKIIEYVGRKTDFRGNTLWEIVGNLPDWGVGRMVIRNMFQRYPEPCYLRILKVQAVDEKVSGTQHKRELLLIYLPIASPTRSAKCV